MARIICYVEDNILLLGLYAMARIITAWKFWPRTAALLWVHFGLKLNDTGEPGIVEEVICQMCASQKR